MKNWEQNPMSKTGTHARPYWLKPCPHVKRESFLSLINDGPEVVIVPEEREKPTENPGTEKWRNMPVEGRRLPAADVDSFIYPDEV